MHHEDIWGSGQLHARLLYPKERASNTRLDDVERGEVISILGLKLQPFRNIAP
jgi:hypothetical protein